MIDTKMFRDIIGSMISGHINSPFDANGLKIYYSGGDLDIYSDGVQMVRASIEDGGVAGNINNEVLTDEQQKDKHIISKVFNMHDVKVMAFPSSIIRSMVDSYNKRYDYNSILASFYRYADEHPKASSSSSLFSQWIDGEENPLIYMLINKNNWKEDLLTDIEKWTSK